jgi:hypothetical protein
MKINLKQLAKFLIEAKTKGGYGFGKKIKKPWRKGFIELQYKKGKFYFRDSYSGFFAAPGQEIVYYNNKPVWHMAYSGGMNPKFHKNIDFAEETYSFLKQALGKVPLSKPFRGPKRYKKGDYVYTSKVTGNIKDFTGVEKVFYKRKEVFRQYYIGGIIIDK